MLSRYIVFFSDNCAVGTKPKQQCPEVDGAGGVSILQLFSTGA